MKRIVCVILVFLLAAALLTACAKEKPPEAHIVHRGQLWKVPEETVEIVLPADAKLTDCTRIPLDVMPSKENECNYTHGTIQVYDGDGFFLVIIDGRQHRIAYESPSGSNAG